MEKWGFFLFDCLMRGYSGSVVTGRVDGFRNEGGGCTEIVFLDGGFGVDECGKARGLGLQ